MKEKGIVIIVGVGKAFGMEMIKAFITVGYNVMFTGTNKELLVRHKEELANNGVEKGISYQVLDVTDSVSINALIENLSNGNIKVECVIYNSVKRVSLGNENLAEEIQSVLNVDLFGAIAIEKVFTEYFVKQGEGCLIFTGGGAANCPTKDNMAMSIGKAALRSFVLGRADYWKCSESKIFLGLCTINNAVGNDKGMINPNRIAQEFLKMFIHRDKHEYKIIL